MGLYCPQSVVTRSVSDHSHSCLPNFTCVSGVLSCLCLFLCVGVCIVSFKHSWGADVRVMRTLGGGDRTKLPAHLAGGIMPALHLARAALCPRGMELGTFLALGLGEVPDLPA